MDLKVRAYQLDHKLKLSEFSKSLSGSLVKSDANYLLFELSGNSYLYIKDLGSVVFFNVNKTLEHDLLASFGHKADHWLEYENYKVKIGERETCSIDFSTIYIPEIDPDLVHLISLNISQSLALKHYQSLVDILLEDTNKLSVELKRTGRIGLSRRRLAKYMGEVMYLRNLIADNLYIFETPPFAWNNEVLSGFDDEMTNELDFENRHRAVQHGLNVVKESHEFFKDLLQHKHSSLLEWIIILLILFEVVQIFI